jgi:hypothetical protein
LPASTRNGGLSKTKLFGRAGAQGNVRLLAKSLKMYNDIGMVAKEVKKLGPVKTVEKCVFARYL